MDLASEIDGREYDAETVSRAIRGAIIGRAPVAVMSQQSLRDSILVRIRWSLGAVTLIASSGDTDDSVKDVGDAAVLQLEQALDMFRAMIASPR